jgi:hypothetical protein
MDVVTDNTQRILGALENPKYQWRTLEGLAAETGVAPDELNQVLAGALSDQVVTTHDKSGRALYTTRQHYRSSQPFVNRLLTVLSDRIR